MVLRVYGIAGSQPARALNWVLAMKDVPHEYVQVQPGAKQEKPILGSRHPSYLAKFPLGYVPAIEDTETGLKLCESHAIMTYLADKFGWDDLYPTNLEDRARVNQWLHWHHQNSRVFTIALFAPIFRPDIKFAEADLKAKAKQIVLVARVMEKQLEKTRFMAGDRATLADISLYEELGQCQESAGGLKACDLFDFSPFPAVQRWMGEVEALPKFQEAHKVFPVLRRMVDKSRARAKSNL